MSKIVLLSLLVAFMLASCGNKKQKNESATEPAIEKKGSITESDEAKNCDEFIDQYEKWMDDYLELMEGYMKNPMDQKLAEKYMNVAQEALNWYEQWGKLGVCASKEKYQKRFEKISEKADKKMKELGLE